MFQVTLGKETLQMSTTESHYCGMNPPTVLTQTLVALCIIDLEKKHLKKVACNLGSLGARLVYGIIKAEAQGAHEYT